MKNVLNIFFALAFCIFCTGTAMAQNTKADKKAVQIAELKRIIDTKNYIFKATTALPTPTPGLQISGGNMGPNSIANQLSSGMINLTGSYDVKLANDTLTAFLPYYGQAFSAPYNNTTDGGITFTSTKFDYKVTQKKNGTFEILIKPQDLAARAPSDVQRMVLTVSEGGWANLQIILVTRQRIAFSGTVEELKPQQATAKS